MSPSPPPGPSVIRYPVVTSHLASGAQLSVRAEVKNASAQSVDGVLKGKNRKHRILPARQTRPSRTKVVHFSPLQVAAPRLWWPAQVGPQNLYPLDLAFETGGTVSDTSHTEFGIREVTSELDSGHRLFHINGKNIPFAAPANTFDMLLRSSPSARKPNSATSAT